MRRLIDLKNPIYKKKYKEIYRILFTADLDRFVDHSNWYKIYQDFVDKKTPLWIICESKILNKRMWITHNWGKLEIATAQLDLDIDSSAYHESYKYMQFQTQKEMAEYLEKMLEPCLEENPTLDNEREEEEIC